MNDTVSYVPLWTLRCLALRRMCSAGVDRLRVDSLQVTAVLKTMPDQTKVFSKPLGRAVNRLTTPEALGEMQYKGPPELISMFMCFLGALDGISTYALEAKQDQMI